jgi:deoxyribodipyrimidine photolyase-like uncharacterized protein
LIYRSRVSFRAASGFLDQVLAWKEYNRTK